MIVNVLQLTLREDLTEDQRADVLTALRRTASVESVTFSVVGPEFSDPSGHTIDYLVAIADVPALERYLHDPVHLAGDDIILPALSRATAVRFADEAVGAQVFAAAEAKAAKYPEWGRRVAELFRG